MARSPHQDPHGLRALRALPVRRESVRAVAGELPVVEGVADRFVVARLLLADEPVVAGVRIAGSPVPQKPTTSRGQLYLGSSSVQVLRPVLDRQTRPDSNGKPTDRLSRLPR